MKVVIERAREMLEREGWAQHTPRDTEGRRCIGQALIDACDELGQRTYTEQCAIAAVVVQPVCAETLLPFLRLMRWNDAPGRTKDEVLDLLRRAV